MTVLTNETFGKFLETNPRAIIFFASPYDDTSVALIPRVIEAYANAASEALPLAVFDCTVQAHVQICLDSTVPILPALHYFKNSFPVLTYEGQQRREHLTAFLTDPESVPASEPQGPPPTEPFLAPKVTINILFFNNRSLHLK
jgi:thioredoxin-like negative regulator of GroEL